MRPLVRPLAGEDTGKPVPRWWADYKEAEACQMSLPELHAWCWHGSGAYYLPRLRVGWAIEAAAERQRWKQAEQDAKHPRQAGWQGGAVDPNDTVAGWADDGDPSRAA